MSNTIFDTRRVQIEYTPGQRTALEKVEAFLKSSDNFFLLAGYSGCGKTTIAENIATYANANLMAPTNAAVNRLKEKINTGKLSTDFSTIHKVLFSPGEKKGNFFENGGLQPNKTYIIDECSMIDKYVLEVIIKRAKEGRCKIIFMGDSFQLEPVGDNPFIFNWEKSYPKEFLPENKYELTEVKRYDGNLLKIATEMRKRKQPSFSKIDNDDLIIVPKFTTSLIKDIRNEASYVVLTSTNNKRVEYNRKIRSARFKLNGNNLNYAMNKDKLVSVNNSRLYSNGEIYTLENARLLHEFTIIVETYQEEPTHKEYRVLVYRHNENVTLLIPDLLEPSMQGATIIKSFEKYNTKVPEHIYKLLITEWTDPEDNIKRMLKKHIIVSTYGYAISCHKAQGQEWDNVYIDAGWLMPVWDKAKWFYTAITRAKCKVQVTTNKYLSIN